MRYFLRLSRFLVVAIVVGSCAGPNTISELSVPLVELQAAIKASLPNPSAVSVRAGGREFVSDYFIAEGARRSQQQVRYLAQANIIGDRRPYRVEVLVFREVRRGDKYVSDGQDDAVATVILRKVRAHLAKRRSERDLIDDFRIF